MADRAAVPKSKAASPKIDAKQAKASAKAAKQAEKARKKASTDPADMGRIKQIRRAYQLTHEYDKALPFLLIGAFLLPIALAVVFGLTVGYMVNAVLIGVGIGVLLPMIVLVRRAKAATYKRYAGQAGSAEVALQMLPKQVGLQPGDRGEPEPRRGAPYARPGRCGADRRG